MSYGVQAYAVDIDGLKKTIASGDAVLAKRLSKKFADDLANVDDIDFDDGLASASDVLKRLIVDGVPGDEGEQRGTKGDAPGYKWGYALEMLCRGLGDWMPPSAFSGMGSEYFDAIDAALKAARSKRKITDVVFRGPPVKLPFIDDFPSIGWLSPKDAAEWRDDLERIFEGAPEPLKPAASGEISLRSKTDFWRGSVNGSVVVEVFGKIGRAAETAMEKLATPKNAQKKLEKLANALRNHGWKDEAAAPEGFSGRVKGTQLIVVEGGKKKITRFPTKSAAQKALISALKKSNAGGEAADEGFPFDSDAEAGLRELLKWTGAATAKKRGLVLFYY